MYWSAMSGSPPRRSSSSRTVWRSASRAYARAMSLPAATAPRDRRPAVEFEDIRSWLTQEWADAFQTGAESILGERLPISWEALDGLPEDADLEWWSQTLSFAPEAPLWVGAAGSSWKSLGQAILAGLGAGTASEEEIRTTCRE